MKKNSNMKKILPFCIVILVLLFTAKGFAQVVSKSTSKGYVSYGSKSSSETPKYLRNLNNIFDYVQKHYVDEIDPKVLYEGALKGLMEALDDPYSVYLDEDSMRDLNDTTVGNFGGVGLQISKPSESTPTHPAFVDVATPIEGTPGAKAGILSGDKIIAINDEPTDVMTMEEVLEKLRGEIGTSVNLKILRGQNIIFDVTLERALIEVPTAKYGVIEGTKIGYVRLIQFTPDTASRLQDALDSFEEEGYTGLILDLRDNPGGLITSAADVADKFIDEGPIVSTKSRIPYENMQYVASKNATKVSKDIPVVVLINQGSASGAEIVAGALKDYHRAYLIGECSYGKGSVQQVMSLGEYDGLKMTVARYYTPSDTNIDKVGIPPDLEIKNIKTFTPEEELLYAELITSNIIMDTVEENPNMSEKEIEKAAKEIAETYPLDERLIRRMIRIQVQRTQDSPLYDMDFDLQLHEAIKVLNNSDFEELVHNTKTLKELQMENKAKEAEKKDASGK